jgi:uncharacterized cupredoxin-like copper-binding protein
VSTTSNDERLRSPASPGEVDGSHPPVARRAPERPGSPPSRTRGALPVVRDDRLIERLDRIESEVRVQGDRARIVQRGFAIFAFMALLIAMATLIAVAVKLDRKGTRTVTPPPAGAAAAPVALGHAVNVGLKEFSVNPSARQAAAGRVKFSVRNAGTVPHELVVLRTSKGAGSLLKGARADEAGNVGETGDLAPGTSKTIALNLKPGHYALICNLPGHYRAGQHVDFKVGS